MAQIGPIQVGDRWVATTTLGAYPKSNWLSNQPVSGAPQGAATATGTVSAGTTITITGLADNTEYWITKSDGTGGYISAKTPGTSTDIATTVGVSGISGTVALPTGASTAAKQPALGTAGTASADVISVQGIAAGTAQPVSAASLPLPTGAASAANQDLATTLTNGRKTSTTPGTAVALRATLACKWVSVTALLTNTKQITVGGSGVIATAGSDTGTPLMAGDSTVLPVSDAATAFLDVQISGEGASFVVGS